MGQTDRVEVPPTDADILEQTGQPTGRQVSLGFRVAAWVTALGSVAVFVFGLLEIVLMWLPDATLLSVIEGLTPADLEFRVQFFAVGIAAWTVVLGLVAQLVRPARHAAGMAQAWGAAATMAAVLAVVGAFGVVDVVILLAVTVVLVLHPSRTQLLATSWRLDRWQGGVVLVGALPWLVGAGVWAAQARDSAGLPGTSDVSAVALWGALATVPVLIVVTALIGASDKPGWRLPAWTSALAATALGAHALVFSGSDGALPVPAAVAAVVWGASFAAVTLRRGRST
jgi:hypothetical protein